MVQFSVPFGGSTRRPSVDQITTVLSLSSNSVVSVTVSALLLVIS